VIMNKKFKMQIFMIYSHFSIKLLWHACSISVIFDYWFVL